jgi:PAS domain S-box-containing protein
MLTMNSVRNFLLVGADSASLQYFADALQLTRFTGSQVRLTQLHDVSFLDDRDVDVLVVFTDAIDAIHDLRLRQINREIPLLAIRKQTSVNGRIVAEEDQMITELCGQAELENNYSGILLEKCIALAVAEYRLRKSETVSQQLTQTRNELSKRLRQVQEAAEQQASLLDAVPARIAVLNEQGEIVAINAGWKSLAHKEVFLGNTYRLGDRYLAEHTDDTYFVRLRTRILGVINRKEEGFKMEYSSPAGIERKWFKTIVSPLSVGNANGALIMHIDVSDRRNAEEALLRSRANLLSIFNNTDDIHLLIDPQLKILALNNVAASPMDFLREPFVCGKSILDCLPVDRAEMFLDKIQNAGDRSTFEYETTYHLSESVRCFSIRVTPVLIGDDVLGYSICGHDVTTQKNIEKELRESEERFRALVECGGRVFCITDFFGDVNYVSPNVEKLFARDAASFLKINFRSIIHVDDLPKYNDLMTSVIDHSSKIFREQVRVRNGRGESIDVELTVINLMNLRSINGVVINFHDVTSKVRTLNELSRHKQFLEMAFKVAKMGYWQTGTTMDSSTTWSPQLYEIFRVDERRFDRKLSSFLKMVYPKDRPAIRAALESAVCGDGTFSLDHRLIRPDGQIIWVHEQAEFIFDEQGNIDSIVGVAKDITQRKSQEEKIRQAKKNVDALINSTSDLIWSCDHKLELVSANKSFLEGIRARYGKDMQEGESVMLMNAQSDEYSLWKGKYEAALRGEKAFFEIAAFDDDGFQYDFDVILNPITDGNKVVGVTGFSRNITGRKRWENEIRRVNERFELLSVATNDAVWDWDLEHGVIFWNHGLMSIFGHNPRARQTSLAWWKEHLHPDDLPTVERTLNDTIRDRKTHWQCDYRFRAVDDSYKYIQSRGYFLYDNGVLVRAIGAMQDVQELTQYRMSLEKIVEERTRELHDALEKERELSEMKSRFVSIASHEFRTPLSTILFAADYLRNYHHRIKTEQIEKKLDSIEGQVQHMMSLLDDVLTVGKADSGKITVSLSKIDLKHFFVELVSNVKQASKSDHQIVMSFNIKFDSYQTDEKLMCNIFSNLLSNALKFSPQGTEVLVQCFQQDDQVIFRICDNGIGIAPGEETLIMEPFNRGSNVGATSGTGLGLAIVNTAVKLLEGNISITHEAKYKTVFTVSLPMNI